MNLKELEAFRAVAELGAISKAAAHLRVAQPALSRRIHKLEHALGVELLQRTSTGVTPTAAGLLLLERTARLESELAEVQREVSGFSSEVLGSLHLAVQAPLSTRLIPDLVGRYRAEHPRVALHTTEGYSADLVDGLLGGRLDLAVVDTPSHDHPDLTITSLWIETMQLIGAAGGEGPRLFGAGPASLAEIARLPLILPSPRYTVRRLVDASFAREHLRVEPVIEVDGPAVVFAMVRRGLGYTLMPSGRPYVDLRPDRFHAVDTSPAIRRPISLVTRTAMAGERKVATFVRLFREAAAEPVGGVAGRPLQSIGTNTGS